MFLNKEKKELLQYVGHMSQIAGAMPFEFKGGRAVTEWKMIGQQAYVVAIEPGNCIPEGRVDAKKNNRLSTLKPGEVYEIDTEIGVLDSQESINQFMEMI